MAEVSGATVYLTDDGEVVNLFEEQYREMTSAVGRRGADVLRGNSLANVLNGNGGDDQLWGGTGGSDTLIGGSGADGYWWGRGDGCDAITAAVDNGADALFLYNVRRGEYNAGKQNDDFHFSLADGSMLDLRGWYAASATERVQSYVFADNVAYAWNNGSGAEVNLS